MNQETKLEDYSLYLLQAHEQLKIIEELTSGRDFWNAKMGIRKIRLIIDDLHKSLNYMYNRSV